MFTLPSRVRGRQGGRQRWIIGAKLSVRRFEERTVPAVLTQSLFPDATGPQVSAKFGYAVASSTDYRVVGVPFSDAFDYYNCGQVFVYGSSTNKLVSMLENPTPMTGDNFGCSVAISGSILVVGAYWDGANDVGGDGSAHIYDLNSMTPTVPAITLRNPNPAQDDRFGISVAISGNIVVVGAHFDDTGAIDAGSAYVYDLSSPTPTVPIAALNNPIPGNYDYFGHSVGVSGTTVAVGAYQNDDGASNAGSIYVYDLNSMTPTLPIVTLNNPTPMSDERFGYSMAMFETKLVVGAYQDKIGESKPGTAYVYDLSSTTPAEPIVTLDNPAPDNIDQFGISVAVSASIVVVGANWNDPGAFDAGSAYVFDLNSIAPTSPIATLNHPTPANYDYFGTSVAVANGVVVVGAEMDDTSAHDTGSTFVFDVNSITPSTPIATLSNSTLATDDELGTSLAVSGSIVVAGASQDDSGKSSVGEVYVYDVNSVTPTIPIATLNSPNPTASQWFGWSAAVSGTIVVAGASGANQARGTAYVFDISSKSPTVPIVTLDNPTPAYSDFFGYSVAVAGSVVVVGAYLDDTGATNAGSAYVYDLNSMTPTVPIVTLNNPTPLNNKEFGFSVAVSGNIVLVGTGKAESAYVYDLGSMTPSVPIVTLNNPTANFSDTFGRSIAASGQIVVVGAGLDDTAATNAGSSYVYDLNSVTPTVPIFVLNNPAPYLSEFFGSTVAVSGPIVVVGAFGESSAALNAGSAYVYNLNSTTPTIPIATVNNPNPSSNDRFGRNVAVSGTTIAIAAPYDNDQNVDQGSVRVYTLAPARVAEVTINDGAAQRSRVTSLTVTFNQPVNFTGPAAVAFQLKRQSDGIPVLLDATIIGNSVTLSFTGGPVDFGSLADGRYTLTIDASQISNSNGHLDGNGDGAAGDNYVLVGSPANGLFRLFGDANGNGAVTALDFAAFRSAYGSAPSIFDFNNDGITGAADFAQFRLRYGVVI